METYENDQYITFPIGDLQEVQDNNVVISHEEICKPESECIVPEVLSESGHVEISDTSTTSMNVADESEDEHVYVREDRDPLTSGDDESMAVEALRQLGGMYPYFEDKKPDAPTPDPPAPQPPAKSPRFTCSLCNEHFDRKSDLASHTAVHQVDPANTCRTCGTKFRTKASLQVHIAEAHQGFKVHKCHICGIEFQRPSSLSNHMKIHTYVAGRAISQLQTSSDQKTSSDSQASTSVVVSIQDYSVQWSIPVYSLDSSEAGGATVDDSGDKLAELAMINGEVAQFEYPGTPEHHFVSIGSFDNSEADGDAKLDGAETERKTVSPIECEFCDKQFQDGEYLASHQKTCIKRLARAGEQAWGKHACAECGKKFTTKQKMFRHQWIHRKKTHCCEVCGAQFERQLQLDEHRLAAHPGDTPFTCSECGKSFVSRQGLWEHGRTHAGSPAHFHCDKCSKTFTSRQGYLIHHRTHTGERPYGCKFCWKAFRDGGTLRKHERIHTGERPHVCPLCSRAFNQKVVLREHVRWVHAAAKHDTEATGPPFPCPLCGDLSQDRDELCAHIVKHSDRMIAEAKAKSGGEPKKPAKAPKRKGKRAQGKAEGKDDRQEEIYLVTDPLEQGSAEQGVFLEGQYILVNAGKKVNLVEGKARGKELQICLGELEGDGEVEKKGTLRLISKRNADAPVLAIPNPQTHDNFSSQIQLVEEGEVEEYGEQEELEIMQVETVQYEQEDNENEDVAEGCRVCGEVGFKDKLELMEHVRTHCM